MAGGESRFVSKARVVKGKKDIGGGEGGEDLP